MRYVIAMVFALLVGLAAASLLGQMASTAAISRMTFDSPDDVQGVETLIIFAIAAAGMLLGWVIGWALGGAFGLGKSSPPPPA